MRKLIIDDIDPPAAPAAVELPNATTTTPGALQPPATPITALTIHLTEALREAARHLDQDGLNIDWDELGPSGAGRVLFVFETASKCASFFRALDECMAECPSQNPLRPPQLINFSETDLADVDELAAKLKQASDPVSIWLLSQLDEATRTELQGLTAKSLVGAELRGRLTKAVCRLVEGALLYDPQRFQSVELCGETQQLMECKPQGAKLVTLNRLLLADAFPMAIAKPPTSVEVRIMALHDLALQLRPLSKLIAETKRDAITVCKADLKSSELFWTAFDPANYQYTEALVAHEGANTVVDAACVETARRLLDNATAFAGEVVAASQPETFHHISITESSAGELTFRDRDAELQLGNSAKRCLMTLAVLHDTTILTKEFHELYAGGAEASKQTAARTFDNAGKALQKQLSHFGWGGNEPRIRNIRGVRWGALADEKLLRARLKMMAPVTNERSET